MNSPLSLESICFKINSHFSWPTKDGLPRPALMACSSPGIFIYLLQKRGASSGGDFHESRLGKYISRYWKKSVQGKGETYKAQVSLWIAVKKKVKDNSFLHLPKLPAAMSHFNFSVPFCFAEVAGEKKVIFKGYKT